MSPDAPRDAGAGVPVVVVPCFNEARRLDERALGALADSGRVRLLFVDDGSTDATPGVLERLAATHEAVEVFTLPANAGKAEAVRRGLLVALRGGATVTGYYDADLATPPGELLRMVGLLEASPEVAGMFGCRVARLGSAIERRAARHYLGRAYATLASVALGITVYDTQCGAKLFRVSDSLAAALAQPFPSPWAFDVELLARLLRGDTGAPALDASAFVEVPLEHWRDVHGSKLRPGAAAGALIELGLIARRRLRGHRAGPAPAVPASVLAPGAGHQNRNASPPGQRRA